MNISYIIRCQGSNGPPGHRESPGGPPGSVIFGPPGPLLHYINTCVFSAAFDLCPGRLDTPVHHCIY